jgi:hypothetical protein
MRRTQCPTSILTMPRAHSVLLPSRPSFRKEDHTPPSYAMVTHGQWLPLKCSLDPTFNISEIKVKPLTLKRKSKPLPMGRYLPPMAPLSVCLPWPTQADHQPAVEVVIDLTNKPSMKYGEPSSAHHQPAKVESTMQVKMSGGTPRLCCRPGGRIMTGGYVEPTTPPRQVAPAGANYQWSQESWQLQLKFKIMDSLRNHHWPQKLKVGEPVPPQLVQVCHLMMHIGHLVQTMTGFVPWDCSLVDDGGRIVAKSQTLDLDPTFSG